MTLDFDARIDGRLIRCRIRSAVPRRAPVFCASLMAPGHPVEGGTLLSRTGGFLEIALPDLEAGRWHDLVLAHDDPAFRPVNRAWLPLGAYLRDENGAEAFPELPAGVALADPGPAPRADGLRLVPQPTLWRPAGGVLTSAGFAGDAPDLRAVDALAARTGLGPFLVAGGTPLVVEDAPDLPAEGYRLRIGAKDVRLAAADAAGRFYAGVTLLTLLRTHGGALPMGTIEDHPRFSYRGQHLDCARHFFAMGTLTRLLDHMALLKLNRFHWHFADDEAFRLEVETLPELWRRTAFRGEGELVPGVFGGGIRSGGSYSKADAAALVAHARALHIEVLPEIEFPAHALGFARAVSGLRDPDDTGTEESVQGYRENVVNPALPRLWEVIEPLALEVAALFPFGCLHLGGDELPPATWDGSPAVAALKRREGLSTRDDVQGWAMARLAAGLAGKGIRSAAWEEAARGSQGGIGHGALLFSWTGQGPGIAAAQAGYDVVMCPAQHVYLDMAHTADPDDWGAAWAAFVSLEDTVAWDPVPPDHPEIAPRIAGVEGTFWSEFTTEDRQVEPMLAPRILGVACKAWESGAATDGPRLRGLAGAYRDLWAAMGWDWNRAA